MDDSIHSFNSEKNCFLSMFSEVVYWKLVTSNKMNFVHVRKNAYFFMLTGFLKICFMLFTQRRRLQEKYRRVRFGNISYLELEKVSKQIILITKISRLNLNDIYYFCVQYMVICIEGMGSKARHKKSETPYYGWKSFLFVLHTLSFNLNHPIYIIFI